VNTVPPFQFCQKHQKPYDMAEGDAYDINNQDEQDHIEFQNLNYTCRQQHQETDHSCAKVIK